MTRKIYSVWDVYTGKLLADHITREEEANRVADEYIEQGYEVQVEYREEEVN